LVELYFFRPDTDGLAGDRFVNLSTRCRVGTDFSMGVAGLVLEEGGRVLLRASGKSLEPFGVTGTLPRPRIRVYDSNGAQIALSAGWRETPAKEAAITAASSLVQAFAFTGPEDDALILDLPKGLYTAEVQDAGGESGIALIEVYLMP
jgi:phytoene dehydrogenase-like protein